MIKPLATGKTMREPFKMPTQDQLLAAHAQFGTDPALLALGYIVEWWDHLDPKVMGAGGYLGGDPPCIAEARSMVDHRAVVERR
jgi:hypothetical protein